MINPELIIDAVAATLRTIPALVSYLGSDDPPPADPRIHAFHFEGGLERPLAKVLFDMPSPGVLVSWQDTVGGNFDGMNIWKHVLNIYIRGKNAVKDAQPHGPPYIWWLICNSAVNGTALNIRQIQILPGELDIVDTPSITHRTDEEGIDYFCGIFTFPEIGDQQ